MNDFLKIIIFVVLELITYLIFIKKLRKQKIGQSIRKEGPSNHEIKKGTPTMGGLIFSLFIIIGYISGLLLFKMNIFNYQTIVIIISILGYGILGFIDDYLIVVRHNNDGLKANIKFIIQMILAAIIFFILLTNNHSTVVNFFGYKLDLIFGYGIFIILFFTSTTNALNLTDGLDGLASGITITILIGTLIYSYYINNINISILIICSIISILGFMFYNIHPAKIFMGNTGSLVLGSLVSIIFIILKIEMLLLIMGLILVLEALSDILQVSYYKITKGKRIFKMAPLHHHFELCGYSEWQIDLMFWMFNLVMSLVGVIIGVRIF